MRKKLLAGIILSTLFISANTTIAAEVKPTIAIDQQEEIVVPKQIETEIYNSIVQVYGEKNAKGIYDRVMQIAKTSLEKRPEELKKEDILRADDWYKDEVIYMFYVTNLVL